MDWDNLQYFLAVSRQGSLSGAAKQLGVNHTTVARRLERLEQQLNNRLFDRLATGYQLTAAGEQLLPQAMQLEEQIIQITRGFKGRESQLTGQLRVSKPSSGVLNLAPAFSAFCRRYSGIQLDIAPSATFSNLNRMEADVAVRLTNHPPETLVGREVGRYPLRLFASADYLKGLNVSGGLLSAQDLDPDQLRWLLWYEPGSDIDMDQMLRQQLPGATVVLRSRSYAEIYEAALAGMGVAPLSPIRLPEDTPLVAIATELFQYDIGVWLLTHPDLRNSARVMAFIRFMTEHLQHQL